MIRFKRWQIVFSVVLLFMLVLPTAVHAQGGGDYDQDGVPDDKDQCPKVPGSPNNAGCPFDQDGDTVPDDKDQCPNVPGLPANNGCPADQDNDGLPDSQDTCPTEAGPADNKGCPVQLPPQPGDRDGDGVTDDKDGCIDQAGPLENGGCPLPQSAPEPPQQPLPALPTDGPCLVATQGYEGVNIRALPDTDSAIVGSLDPFQVYPVLALVLNGDETWLGIAEGWIAGWVSRQGGDCSALPRADLGPAFDGSKPGSFVFVPILDGGLISVLDNGFHSITDGTSLTQVQDNGILIGLCDGSEPSDAETAGCGVSLFDGQAGLMFLNGGGFDGLRGGSVSLQDLHFESELPAVQNVDPQGILIGLSLPAVQEVNPAGILIGLLLPAVQDVNPQGILIGLSQPSVQDVNPQGILIGLSLPAVQDVDLQGILIGLSLPAVQDVDLQGILIGLSLPAVEFFDAATPGPDGQIARFEFGDGGEPPALLLGVSPDGGSLVGACGASGCFAMQGIQ
jgi:hypothetical protein